MAFHRYVMLVTVLDVLSSKLSTLLGEQLVGLAKVADVVDVGTVISLGDLEDPDCGRCAVCQDDGRLQHRQHRLRGGLDRTHNSISGQHPRRLGISRSYRQCPGLGYGWHGRREAYWDQYQ